MAYVKNNWVDQEVERPKTYEMTNNADGSVTLVDSFGLVSELGTPVNADNMNHIEEGIAGCDLRKYNLIETYEKGEWVTGVVEGLKGIYESLTSNNYGNPLSDTSKWQKVELGGGSTGGLNMFDRVRKDHILSFEESKGLALLGTYVYKTGVAGERYGYPDFIAECLKQKGAGTETQITLGSNTITMYVNPNGHIFYDIADKAAVDAWFDTWGIAWFYGVDEENERIFLPRNIKYFKNGTVDNVGQRQGAAAPNIKGSTNEFNTGWTNTSWHGTGALYKITERANSGGGNQSGTYGVTLGLDASLSSSVYKDGATTIDVDSTNLLVYMVVGNTEQQSAVTDVVDITTSENDTIPLGFSAYQGENIQSSLAWLASEGQWNSGEKYKTFYNHYVPLIGQKFCEGYVRANTDEYTDYDLVINQDEQTFRLPLLNGSEDLPSDKFDELELNASGSTYTAPANGWYWINKKAAADFQYIDLINNTSGTTVGNSASGTNETIRLGLATLKGDVVKIDYNTTGVTNSFRFYYAKGNGILYFKVGNAVQNQELIDVAALNSEVETKLSRDNKAEIVNWGMPDWGGEYNIINANTTYKVEKASLLVWQNINETPNTITITDPNGKTFALTSGLISSYGKVCTFMPIGAKYSFKFDKVNSQYKPMLFSLLGGV